MKVRSLICVALLLHSAFAYSQTELKGLLIDSSHNMVLESATISIYEREESKVSRVSLTDRYGKFLIKDLPDGKPLRVEFSFQGFEKVIKRFQLLGNEKKDLGRINMTLRTDELAAVEILAPVRMNGDTIEFNADAFQLDTNAVIEDLLHKLPGIVVWGDGKVTYKGREVPTVLVNGKPFFGHDKGIALQNIASEAVEKLQVYDRRSPEEIAENPLNPSYEMNVVLKEGREDMYFGNLMLAAGTEDRYEGNANMNYANKRTQSTLAYSINNTNKYLNNVDQLLRNTTFKGVGVNADFDSDFLRQGILRQQVLGARFQYDILGTNEVNKQHRIEGNILVRSDQTLSQDSSFTQLLAENSNEVNERSRNSSSEQALRSQNGQFAYYFDKKINYREWNLNTNLRLNRSEQDTEYNSFQTYDYSNSQSTNETFQDNKQQDQKMKLDLKLGIGSLDNPNSLRPSFFHRLSYDFEVNTYINRDQYMGKTFSQYQNFINEDESRSTNRIYDNLIDERSHTLVAGVNFNNFRLKNQLTLYRSETDAQAGDIQETFYTKNDALTHESQFHQRIYTPTLHYSNRLVNTHLPGRKGEYLAVGSDIGYRIYQEENRSTLDFRNLVQDYNTFLPRLSLTYGFTKIDRFDLETSLVYSHDEDYPTLNQLRPIYNDIDPAYRYFGGIDLAKVGKQSITGNFSYRELKQHGYYLRVIADYTRSRNGFGDSLVFSGGQQEHYIVNINQAVRSLAIRPYVSRSFLLGKERTLNFELNGALNWSNRFQYVNHSEQAMVVNSQSAILNSFYTQAGKFQMGWRNEWSRYEREDIRLATNSYRSMHWGTGMSISYQLSPKLNLSTNATARINRSSFNSDEALVWNANTSYRFMKGNNLLFKLAAYDLLKQNKGLYYTNGLTEFTTGYRNNLKQYFMVSISYFPRKFGLSH